MKWDFCKVITPSIYSLLNVSSITALTNGIYSMQAPQRTNYPIIILNESRTFERFKRGVGITHFDLQLDIYSDKGEEGTAGLKECSIIESAVLALLSYYSGTVAGNKIDTILHESSESFYDIASKKARIMMEFNIRVIK